MVMVRLTEAQRDWLQRRKDRRMSTEIRRLIDLAMRAALLAVLALTLAGCGDDTTAPADAGPCWCTFALCTSDGTCWCPTDAGVRERCEAP